MQELLLEAPVQIEGANLPCIGVRVAGKVAHGGSMEQAHPLQSHQNTKVKLELEEETFQFARRHLKFKIELLFPGN